MRTRVKKLCSENQSEIKLKLDKDYQKLFKPFYYINTLFCNRKYNIKNDIAYPLNKINAAVAVLMNIMILVCYYFTMRITDFNDKVTENIYIFVYSQYVFAMTTLTMLVFLKRKANYRLLMKLQEMGEMVKNHEHTNKLMIFAWVFCTINILIYVFVIVVKLMLDSKWHWTRGVFILTAIVFEMEVVQCAFIMLLLRGTLQKWKETMLNCRMGCEVRRLRYLKASFETIMSVFCLTKKAYQTVVLLHFIMTFLQCLIYVEILIIWSKRESEGPSSLATHVVGVCSWLVKGMTIDTLLCIACELFYEELENVRVAVIQNSCEGPEEPRCYEELRRFRKCILRIMDSHFTKLNACCVFTVDAALPLRFFEAVATYTIVLLQFAFL